MFTWRLHQAKPWWRLICSFTLTRVPMYLPLPPVCTYTNTPMRAHTHPHTWQCYSLRQPPSPKLDHNIIWMAKFSTPTFSVSLKVHSLSEQQWENNFNFSFIVFFFLLEASPQEETVFSGFRQTPTNKLTRPHWQGGGMEILWLIYYLENLGLFLSFGFLGQQNVFFGKIVAHVGIFFQLSWRLCSTGWGDDRAHYVFRHGGGRETDRLIRIWGSEIKTVSLLFGESYMIQLTPLVPAWPLSLFVKETHVYTHYSSQSFSWSC